MVFFFLLFHTHVVVYAVFIIATSSSSLLLSSAAAAAGLSSSYYILCIKFPARASVQCTRDNVAQARECRCAAAAVPLRYNRERTHLYSELVYGGGGGTQLDYLFICARAIYKLCED